MNGDHVAPHTDSFFLRFMDILFEGDARHATTLLSVNIMLFFGGALYQYQDLPAWGVNVLCAGFGTGLLLLILRVSWGNYRFFMGR